MNPSKETLQATELLKGKIVDSVKKLREKELLIEFTDGTRLFIDWKKDALELSITSSVEEEN